MLEVSRAATQRETDDQRPRGEGQRDSLDFER